MDLFYDDTISPGNQSDKFTEAVLVVLSFWSDTFIVKDRQSMFPACSKKKT